MDSLVKRHPNNKTKVSVKMRIRNSDAKKSF